MPFILQVFIGRTEICADVDFERKLYIIRKRVENLTSSSYVGETFICQVCPHVRSFTKAC